MKSLGMIALAIGIVGLLASLNMDTSVATGLGGRVINIGLLNDKQNLLVVFAVVSVIGALFLVFGGKEQASSKSAAPNTFIETRSERACPFCAESIKSEAVLCRFCQRTVEPANQPSQLISRAPLKAIDVASANENVAALVRMGCRVTRPAEDHWEVLHPSGATSNIRSPEAMQLLVARFTSESKSPPMA